MSEKIKFYTFTKNSVKVRIFMSYCHLQHLLLDLMEQEKVVY
jgi:hypothetical protein